jgi:1-hydroxycarotenoid 3,4-desaturase
MGPQINRTFRTRAKTMSRSSKVVVVGAGVGGLAAALDLAGQGCEVVVVERASTPGGKIREIEFDGQKIDAGPTVFTMKWVFDSIFEDAGAKLSDYVVLEASEILARHAWSADERLDLFSDVERSADAIGAFAGPAEARGYVQFCERARQVYATLEKSFILSPRPSPMSLVMSGGLRGLGDLWRISPFETLWSALGTYFHDPRLRQLFGRYATYCGSSPFDAPATLMLIAHVEREGVWLVRGGMHRLAAALADLCRQRGVDIRYQVEAGDISLSGGRAAAIELSTGEMLSFDSIVVNADAAAVSDGYFGETAARAVDVRRSTRSLSAVTWALMGETAGFPLTRHNVFFSRDYEREFDDIFRRRMLPSDPTVYVCAQDRGGRGALGVSGAERLFVLVNAPPTGDSQLFDSPESERCTERVFKVLERCGLSIRASPEEMRMVGPQEFERLFPATGGALYGQASHGWAASFARPKAKTSIPGLYLAGGSTHPGPGVPMAALSGRLAAAQVMSYLASMTSSHAVAMPGGMSTR